MNSIVIPAHNESAVLPRLLSVLRLAAKSSDIRVCVVANGCTDDTVGVVRECWPEVAVLETPMPSKTAALNLGDMGVRGFPRFYLDADIWMNVEAIGLISVALKKPGILAASPRVEHDVSKSSWAVRAFYAIDSRMPSSRVAIGSSGVYALTEEGRARFKEFPAIVADDTFVRWHFKPHECIVVNEAVSIVTPPRRLAGLIKIKTRSHYGNYELAAKFPELLANKSANNRAELWRLSCRPLLWPKLGVYLFVKVIAKLRAKKQWKEQSAYIWERDDSSRIHRHTHEAGPVAEPHPPNKK